MALPKSEKLKDRSVFRKHYKLKLVEQNAYFKLFARFSFETEKPAFPKVGLVMSKKKLKSAVKRNLCKRRIGEAYRLAKPKLIPKLFAFGSLIFFIEATVLNVPFSDLIELITKIKSKNLS